MSTNNSNSTNHRTGSEQSYRGNRHRRQQGGRPYQQRRYSNPRTSASQNSRVAVDLRVTIANRSPSNAVDSRVAVANRSPSNVNGDQSSLSPNDSTCFICAEPVHYLAVSECNHKYCHLCSLRLRALYKNKNCAYCKTEQIKIIFTRNPDKKFQEFQDSDIPYYVRRLNAYCEDEEMFDDINLLLGYNCPDSNCEVLCNGWGELKHHVRIVHRLWLCDICTRHKKIFTHEHSLFTHEELNKHMREGDEVTGFSGHPECQFCKKPFYGNDELYEHCRDNHEQCFICVRAGVRDSYFRNYNALEEHFGLEHYLCQHKECLEKKFIVFTSDIDLKAHEVDIHGANFSGQRANRYEARRIETNFNYGNSHTRDTRGRGRRRSRERQPERWADGDGPGVDEITRQTQNLNLDYTTFDINGTAVNARAVRPPPGFGVLSPDEAIGLADELFENEVEIRNTAFTRREEDFPTLSDAMKVTINNNNNSGTIINYSEKLKKNSKSEPRPKPADKPTQSVASSSRSVASPKPPQQPLFESTNTMNKRSSPAFPPLPSANQSISASNSSSSSVLNYREKALSGIIDSDISSHNFAFYQRVSTLLSNDPAKMEEFRSLTIAYNRSILDAFSYIESLLPLFNKNKDTVGKVVSGLEKTLDDEKKKTELLSAWHDHKVKKTADFPALEPIYSTVSSVTKPYITTPPNKKPSARVLVIKSSTNRFGGAKASSGLRVWDKIAAIAESKTKEKSNSAFPSLATSATATSSNNNSQKESQSPSRSESTSPSLNSPNISPYTTAFVRGRPTKAENDEFPVLPSTSSTPRSKNNGPEKNAWGQGGAFTTIVSDNNQNENDSEDDSLYSESTKERGKKKKQKKQKTVLFHHGQKNIYS